MSDYIFSPHPICDLFPPASRHELSSLAADIRQNGLLVPITLFEGLILDGRSRALACEQADVEPVFIDFLDNHDEALRYAVSMNVKRRHLTASQRAMIAAKIANMPHGGDRRSDQGAKMRLGFVSQGAAAKMLGVGLRSLQSATKVLNCGIDELIEAVEKGKLSVGEAARACDLPKAFLEEVLASIWFTAQPRGTLRSRMNDAFTLYQGGVCVLKFKVLVEFADEFEATARERLMEPSQFLVQIFTEWKDRQLARLTSGS